MKKLSFTILVVLASLNLLIAQNSYGIQVGIGLSKMAPPFYPDNSGQQTKETPKIAYLLGFYYESELTDKLGIGFGLNLNQTNSYEEWTVNNQNDYAKVDKRMTNLGIPVYLKINASEKLYLNLGLRPSINLSSKIKTERIDDQFINYYSESEIGVDFIVIGGQYGLGYSITDKIKADVLFYHDYSNIFNSDIQENYGKLRSWQMLVGIKYALK